MRELGVREFRTEWTNLTGEVVRIVSRGRLIGHWIPADNPLRWDGDELFSEKPMPHEVRTEMIPGKVGRDVPTMTPGSAPRSRTIPDGLNSEAVPPQSVARMRPDQSRAAQRTRTNDLLNRINKGNKG